MTHKIKNNRAFCILRYIKKVLRKDAVVVQEQDKIGKDAVVVQEQDKIGKRTRLHIVFFHVDKKDDNKSISFSVKIQNLSFIPSSHRFVYFGGFNSDIFNEKI